MVLSSANDISGGSFNFYNVRRTFQGAHQILTSSCYRRADVLRSPISRKRWRPDELSILGSILNVGRETINHRRLIDELYEDGTLHALCKVPKRTWMGPAEKDVPESDVGGKTDEEEKPEEEEDQSERRPPVTNGHSRSMHKLWEGEDREEEDNLDRPSSTRDEGNDEGEESRYEISNKRRKLEKEDLFTADEDSLDEEEAEYANPSEDEGESKGRRPPDLERTGRNRSYWLSKGIPLDSE